MAVFVIGDTHLSLSCDKPMDVFGARWENYVARLEKNWNENICGDDSVVIAGDISWGMTLEQSLEDFRFINNLNGKKYILKGNHDYWWNTIKKMEKWIDDNGFDTIKFVHNNAYLCEDIIICGSRGWFINDNSELTDDAELNQKILNREVNRLSLSITEAKKIKAGHTDCTICAFIHYPPIYGGYTCTEIIELLRREEIKFCYYGHIHNAAENKIIKSYSNINFELVSADYLSFNPLKIQIKLK